MGKKAKKFETEDSNPVETNETKDSNPVEAKTPAVPKAPSFFLRDEGSGVEYKFDKMRQLPKKAAVMGDIWLDGVATPFQVTTNKGFTPEDKVLSYSWMSLPDGTVGYITHDYLVTPEAGKHYTLNEGVANRKNPERIAKDDTVGVLRIEKFKATMAAKKAAEPAVEPTEPQPA